MAKKRVHEIAKERGISSKEVLAVLQKAGLDVKAAASSVDEDDIKRAFSNGAESATKAEKPKQAAASGDGAQAKPASTPQQDAPKQADKREPEPEQAAQPPADGGQRQQRPQRRPEQGGGGGGGRRRRVVIDSRESVRPQGPPPVQHPPRRGRGRRRRTPWVEPDLTAQPDTRQEEPPTQINSGATVKEVAESLGLGASE